MANGTRNLGHGNFPGGELGKLLRTVRKLGYRIDRSGGGHYKVYAPGGLVILHGTNAEGRAMRNARATLKRKGVELP